MTPLFPAEKEAPTIIQGRIGDCYLLAALDCLFHSGDEARSLLESKFKQTADGVTVRIKHNSHSMHLKPEKMNGKFIYTYDRNTDEDVFFLDNDRLNTIDKPGSRGAKTNSLAIKILERISSYYYSDDWDSTQESASLNAHDLGVIHRDTASRFVGKLLGVQAGDCDDIKKIIKLKLMNPSEPVYISYKYGQAQANGAVHDYHALRIEKVVLKQDGSYDFILVNPWDNQKREIINENELSQRDPKFSTFMVNEPKKELTATLLGHPIELGEFIFKNPVLFPMLFQMQKLNLLTDETNLRSITKLHIKMPYLVSVYSLLSTEEQRKLLNSVVDSEGNKKKCIKSIITAIPRMDVVKMILEKEPLESKVLGLIVEMAAGAKKDERSPLRTLFNDPAFFSTVINAAIHSRKQVKKCSREQARQFIELKLVNYYFDTLKVERLSGYAGIRDFFAAHIFSKGSIETLLSPRILLAHAVVKYLSGPFSKLGIEYLQKCKADLVNEEFLKIVLDYYPDNNPRELFVGLHKLSQINPALVKTLFPLITQKMDQRFGVSAQLFAEDVVLEEKSEFKNWFILMHDPKLMQIDPRVIALKKANSVIEACIKKINEFPVGFETAENPKAILVKKTKLLREVEELVAQNRDLPKALITLGCSEDHSDVMKAYETKKQMIYEKAKIAENKIEAMKYLNQIKFENNLVYISGLVGTIEKKASQDSKFIDAAQQGRGFYEELVKAKDTLISSDKHLVEAFKNSCLAAIKKATPALATIPDWNQSLGKISALLGVFPKVPSATVRVGVDHFSLFAQSTSTEPSVAKSAIPKLPAINLRNASSI